MSALSQFRSRPPQASGRGAIPSVWRGIIVETYTDGTVGATVPSLFGDQAVRMPCVVAGLTVDARVLVVAIEGRSDDLIVIAPG
jgi:hypothetical protein